MDRPHIRFIGETGKEDTKWYNHKQLFANHIRYCTVELYKVTYHIINEHI